MVHTVETIHGPARAGSSSHRAWLSKGVLMLFCLMLSLASQAADWHLSIPTNTERAPDHPAGLPVGSVFQVHVDAHALARADSAELSLPDGSVLSLDLMPAGEPLPGGNRVLHGHARPGTGPGHALLTVGEAGMFGRIGSPAGHFMLHTDVHGTWLIRLDDPRIDLDHACAGPVGDLTAHRPTRGEPSGPQQIDIFIVYTAAMLDRYPGSLIETRLNHLVAIANQAMVDAQVDMVVRLVHHELTGYDDSENIFDALNALRQGLAGEGSGAFADLDDLRAQHGADLVVMMWPHDIDTRGACGVAFLPDWDEDAQAYDSTAGVHVTNDGISNWSVCSDAVFTHELGHNLGSVHQRFDGAPDGINYAHVVPGRYNTVMSSFGSNDINRYMRMPVFSNPDIQCGGAPCGSMLPGEEANVAQTVRDFAPIVSAYAAQTVPGTATPPPPSFPDSDGDGVNDWDDPYPFDPYDGDPPPTPPAPEFTPPPLLPGTELDHYELLVASSGNDQIHAYAMDGSHRGLAVQAELPPFPDERPALSEFTDFAVRDDGLVYMLAVADVRRYDRVSRAQVDVFLDSQPPWQPPNSLLSGFPRGLWLEPAGARIVVLGEPFIEVYDGDALFEAAYPLPDADDPKQSDFSPALRDLAFDLAGGMFVLEALNRRIVHFAGPTGSYLGEVVPPNGPDLTSPWAMALGPDEALYVANGNDNNVLRVNPATGDTTVFIPAGSGGLAFARALTFGPDGQLYVISRGNNAVLRYDAASGDFIDAFLPPGSPGLDQPQSMQFTVRIASEVFRDRFED